MGLQRATELVFAQRGTRGRIHQTGDRLHRVIFDFVKLSLDDDGMCGSVCTKVHDFIRLTNNSQFLHTYNKSFVKNVLASS